MANHPTSTKWIWRVFWLLLIITAVEVALGLMKPEVLEVKLLSMKLLNWTFIILTLVKAYYIVMSFMHLKDERKNLRMVIVLPVFILIPYLTFILLVEGGYIEMMMQ
ncbi:MAG: cytochrome c oxidase subunit 4 [Candidatus Azotimanducaceae bacterium]|jgi:cytochrome c oxidase subunit 4